MCAQVKPKQKCIFNRERTRKIYFFTKIGLRAFFKCVSITSFFNVDFLLYFNFLLFCNFFKPAFSPIKANYHKLENANKKKYHEKLSKN